ncbi:uncharacterized protein LOC143882622 isoform X2 [Tasmannia lanceolata]|uniref:uncharacterized protein LOC143882622 isoform X2 n=1 Tax=Tasmannia lanceolata TaxID=3420 RepID=UPI004063D4C0
MATSLRLEDYAHSPVHYAIAISDHTRLARLISTLPRLTDPTQIKTESDSLAQEKLADKISTLLDSREVPHRETPLHLAVRLSDLAAVRSLASAGADVSLHNAAGWNPLQEAICSRKNDIALTLLRHHHRSAWSKWRRRLPRLVAVLRRMRDFYMEISFHFESSLLPFVGRIAPSDTYRIWKRDGNLRADTSLAGFDGLKIQRAEQSFLFLGDGDRSADLPSGSLLVLNRNDKEIFDAFENAGAPLSSSDESGFYAQTSVYRPGMDVTRAELVGRTNWRRQERTESVGEWKARVYEIHNVVFSFRTRKIAAYSPSDEDYDDDDFDARRNQAVPLVFKEKSEDGFLVAENPNFEFDMRRNSSFEKGDYCYNSNRKMKGNNKEWIEFGRQSVDLPPPSSIEFGRKSVDLPRKSVDLSRSSDAKQWGKKKTTASQTKESEYVKSLRPSVWLTEQFPLKTEELLPLLDILANKVKAVRRLRELLTTKFPPGTFPVAIPVVPTVRVVVTFTKFVDLQPQFFTPMSSPRHFTDEQQASEKEHVINGSSFSSSARSKSVNSLLYEEADPFVIPSDYTWTSIESKNQKMKKSKSKKGGKF